ATATATGVKGESLAGLDLGGTTHTNASDYAADAWTFTDSTGNYNNASGTVHDRIDKANAVINVTPYSLTYDGNPHTATATATGVKGESLAGLDLGGTTHTNASDYAADAWTFTDSTGNYNNASGSVHDEINQADATIKVDGYTGVYDGNAHGATGTATGVKAEDLSSLLNLGASFTNVPGGTANWSFAGNTNYKAATGSAAVLISQAAANISVLGYSGVYDGNPHGATGTAMGVKAEDLSSLLNLGASFTDVPGGTANWSFAGNTNYKPASGSANIVIDQANATISVQGYSGTYDGNPHGASGTASGVKGENLSGMLNLGASFANVPGGTAYWTFAGDGNYKAVSGSVQIMLAKAGSTVMITVPGGASFTYDSNPHPATVSVTGAGGLNLTPAPLYSCGHVPTYVADLGCTASYSFAGDNDHTASNATVTYTIARAPLVVSANSASMILDAPLPQFSGTLVGVLGSDGISASYTTGATGTVIGAFAITPVLSDPNNRLPNYNLTSHNGTLTVQYAAAGLCYGDYGHQILAPIAANGTSTFKQGSTIPAKFRVCDALGNSISAVSATGVPVVAQFNLIGIISGTVTQTVDQTVASTTPDTAFRWDATGQQWIFNISTKGLPVASTYVYQIVLNDGSKIQFQYGLPR
ncbi:MAG TPA: PxKF domain-containing protein, partial [Terriglobales bacterium]|nr:PxKF domain-containing protein [Terriglobales bacterium]